MRDVSPPDNLAYIFFSDPKFIDKVYNHIANGGALTDMAHAAGVRYCDVMKVIRSNSSYMQRYEQALKDRGEWVKETVLNELRRLVLEKTEEDEQTGEAKKAHVRDRLKAIELLGKNLSLFIEKHEVKGNITLDQLILDTQNKAKSQGE